MRAILVVGGLVALIVATSGSAQLQQNGECITAKTWHLQQAMKARLADEQPYHLGAAEAADEELSTMGGSPCSGWQKWGDVTRIESDWSAP